MESHTLTPVKKRYVVLDALRGFAILGIILANFPEFSLWTFQSAAQQAAMPSAGIDTVVRWLQAFFVDGKFYTLFSLLFGIGFSIILSNARDKGRNGLRIFCRRMTVLLLIGLGHMMLLWSGDILLLYALTGLVMVLFRNLSDRALLRWSAFFLLLPVAVEAVTESLGIVLSAPLTRMQWDWCGRFGITEENFGVWLRDAGTYGGLSQFLVQGAFERMYEFVEGHRYFKVLGLFLLGYWVGRNRLYAEPEAHRALLRKVLAWGLCIGIPVSLLQTWHTMAGGPWGRTAAAALYAAGVFPMGLAYAAGFCLLYLRWENAAVWKVLAFPGRMACTNYLGQSVIGILLFYGVGLGLGASVGLAATELIAAGVFLFQTGCSALWLQFFKFGPVEWIWRMLTYGKYLPMRRSAAQQA